MEKRLRTPLMMLCLGHAYFSYSQIVSTNADAKIELFKEIPNLKPVNNVIQDTLMNKDQPFKPSVHVGAVVHMFASYQQNGFGPLGNRETAENDPDGWSKEFSLYRALVLVGGKLSKNGSFFLETALPTAVGRGGGNAKNVKVSNIILDAQYEHTFGNHMVVAGLQLVSHTRNGLQGIASLMTNDFTYFQYAYNLFAEQPLQGNFGRDLGINTRGFFLKDKLEYRFGIFTGRNTGEFVNDDPALRYVGRVAYNFFNAEKDYYYAGTKLGTGKTLALGGGFDMQGTYQSFGLDLYLDMPTGAMGSITANAGGTAVTGGTDTEGTSFASLIPKQTTQFVELGYYFNKSKLQPWIKYERQAIDADGLVQTKGIPLETFNDRNSITVFGGGLNYWFAGYNTNLKLSYTTWNQQDSLGNDQMQGQIWLQTQFFIF